MTSDFWVKIDEVEKAIDEYFIKAKGGWIEARELKQSIRNLSQKTENSDKQGSIKVSSTRDTLGNPVLCSCGHDKMSHGTYTDTGKRICIECKCKGFTPKQEESKGDKK